MVCDKHVLVFRMHDDLDPNLFLARLFLAGIKNDLDLLNPVVVLGELVGLLFRMGFHRGRDFHMTGSYGHNHVPSPYARYGQSAVASNIVVNPLMTNSSTNARKREPLSDSLSENPNESRV